MPSDERRVRWQQRYLESGQPAPQAASVLQENVFLLPAGGSALDLACGRGGNALLLAGHNLEVSAWDYAPAAIQELDRTARAVDLSLRAEVRDVIEHPPAPNSFDVIVVSYFLERSLVPAIRAALRPGGLLFYETFTREQVVERGPSNPLFRLEPNELLQLFAGMRVLAYREYGLAGDLSQGARDTAWLVARNER